MSKVCKVCRGYGEVVWMVNDLLTIVTECTYLWNGKASTQSKYWNQLIIPFFSSAFCHFCTWQYWPTALIGRKGKVIQLLLRHLHNLLTAVCFIFFYDGQWMDILWPWFCFLILSNLLIGAWYNEFSKKCWATFLQLFSEILHLPIFVACGLLAIWP